MESTAVGPDDRQYRAVVDKRFKKRFSASPDYVRLVRIKAGWDPRRLFRHTLSIRVG